MNAHLQTVTAYREPNGRTRTEHEILTTTAASRERCAKKLEGLAVQCGWQFETRPGYLDKREINVTLRRDGFAVSASFIGGSKVGAFLAHWHTDLHADAKYPESFTAGQVNPHHFRKATTCEDRWPVFLDRLKAGMLALAQPANLVRVQ